MKRMVMMFVCALPLMAQAELGRLFHTPEQRAFLDLARKTGPESAIVEPDAPSTEQGLSVSGIVTRSDGKRSTWVNGRVEHDAAVSGKRDGSQVWVKVPGGEVKLKVGQSLDPATGQVAESYRHAPPPPPAVSKPAPPKSPTKPPVRDDNADSEQPATQ